MSRCVARVLFTTVACGLASAAETTEMWNCHLGGPPTNVVVLVNRGVRSYVKIAGQRASATYHEINGARRWTWGRNAIVLDDEGLAQYFEGGDTEIAKTVFRCRRMR